MMDRVAFSLMILWTTLGMLNGSAAMEIDAPKEELLLPPYKFPPISLKLERKLAAAEHKLARYRADQKDTLNLEQEIISLQEQIAAYRERALIE